MSAVIPAIATAPPSRRTKQGVILAAAARLLTHQGFEQTSMEAVAREAGVSKATLYAYFASKQELFARIVADAGERHSAALRGTAKAADLPTVLLRAALDFSQLILSPGNIAITRMAVAEGPDAAELGARFFAAGPEMLLQHLAAVLEHAMQRGDMTPAPPRLAAAQFINLVVGELQLRALLNVAPLPTTRASNAVARAGAAAFMRAYHVKVP
jgi:TetR/AcrR family transcriptional repressor of mexJK operon